MGSIDALIFDLDGLLVDSEPLAAEAMLRFLDSFGIAQKPAVQRQLLGRRVREAIALCKEGYDLPGSLEELTETYGLMRMEALRGSVMAMPGAREILQFGRDRGLKVGLATSAMRLHADISLTETGLAGLFDSEVTGDEVQRGKPSPELFLTAAERLGSEPERSVVFEDSPLGIEAAVGAGMVAVAIRGHRTELPEFPIPPDILLDSLNHAIVWLEERMST
ncbi:HAD family phosphatase [soil metagenome]